MKKLLLALLAVALSLGAAAVGLRLWLDPDRQRERIAAMLGDALGREVELGPLSLTFLPLAFSAERIAIGERAGQGDSAFLSADALRLRLAWAPLLRARTLNFESIEIDAPRLRLARDARGNWNFDDLGAGREAEPGTGTDIALVVERLRLRDGEVVMVDADGRSTVWTDLQVELGDIAIDRQGRFSLSARQGQARVDLQGVAGPLKAGRVMHTPLDARIALAGLDLAGHAGKGVEGRLDFNGSLRADAGALASEGKATLAGFRIDASATPSGTPLDVDYRFDYDLDRHTGRFGDTQLGIGPARFALDGGVDLARATPRLDLAIEGKAVPIDPLQDILPALGIVLPERSRLAGGRLETRLQVRGPADALVISGPASVADTRLAGFSLGRNVSGLLSLGGVQMPADTVLKSASTRLRIDANGVALDQIAAEVEQLGQVTGQGRISADEALDFTLRLRLDEAISAQQSSSGGLGGTLRGLLNRGSRDGIGLRIDGPAASPRIRVDAASLVGLGDPTRPQEAREEEASGLRDRLRRLRNR